MPAASPPGNRVRLEKALGPDLVAVIHRLCSPYPIPRNRWHRVPKIAGAWEVLAVDIEAERLGRERGLGAKSARAAAAIHLGLNPDTIESRLRDGHTAAFRPVQSGVDSQPENVRPNCDGSLQRHRNHGSH